MQIVPLSSLIVPPDRIRREFNPSALADLTESILTQGLFHPLLVRPDGVTLIAGERRKRVLEFIYSAEQEHQVLFDGNALPRGYVPIIRLTDADATGALEAELSENTRRQQLTWQEQAAATKALHDLRVVANPEHTRADTAREFANGGPAKNANAMVYADLTVAAFLDDEEVAKAPDRKAALKVIERRLVAAHNAKLMETFGSERRTDTLQCYHGDMRTVLAGLPLAADCIIADAPYGIDADKFANQSAVRHEYADDAERSDQLYDFIAGLIETHTAPSAHAYIFCDVRRFPSLVSIFARHGWRVWPWPLVWSRGSSVGLLPWPEHGPRRTYDAILYAIKGDRRITGVFPDVLSIPHDGTRERGAHKPAALYAELIRRSCSPGNVVLDPCCGTGPVFEAARLTNVRAVGIEIEENGYSIACQRITDPLADVLEWEDDDAE